MAGSAHTITTFEKTGILRKVVTTWTADDSDGSVPTVSVGIQGRLLLLRTNPGSTAPTANYDVTAVDADSIDQLQGVGADRHTSNTEEALITYSGSSLHPYVRKDRPLVITVANNSVNSATGTIEIVYEYVSQGDV